MCWGGEGSYETFAVQAQVASVSIRVDALRGGGLISGRGGEEVLVERMQLWRRHRPSSIARLHAGGGDAMASRELKRRGAGGRLAG